MTNLSDREQLKKAIKSFGDDTNESLEVLIEVAESYLEASVELPERMAVDSIGIDAGDNHSMQCYGKGLNHAIDLCTPIVARLKAERDSLQKAHNYNIDKIASLESQLSRMSKSNDELRKELKNYTGCKMGEVVKSTTA